MIKIMKLSEFESSYKELGIADYLFKKCTSTRLNRFESYENTTIIYFWQADVSNDKTAAYTLRIFMSAEHLLFLCENSAHIKKVEVLIDAAALESGTNERVLHSFFDNLIKNDTDVLEDFEETITDLEDDTITNDARESMSSIIVLRRQMLRLKRYYEQLNSIFEGLLENDNGLIKDKNERYFKILDNRADRLFNHVVSLRDYVTQVREAYQAQVDIKSNNLMKLFTVMTAIFSPLTLIVGWYGMNVKMPEFGWTYGYAFVIALSVGSLALCIALFKRNKWF